MISKPGMSSEKEEKHDLLFAARTRVFSRVGLITIGALVFVIILGGGGGYVFAMQYEGKIAPGIQIGSVDVGGMDPVSATQAVQQVVDNIITSGIPVRYEGKKETLPLTSVIGDTAIDFAAINVEAAVARALDASHREHPFSDAVQILSQTVRPTTIELDVKLDTATTRDNLRMLYPEVEQEPENAGFTIVQKGSDWLINVTEPEEGILFDVEDAQSHITSSLSTLSTSIDTVEISVKTVRGISSQEANETIPHIERILENAPIELTLLQPGRTRTWNLSDDDLADMLELRNQEGEVNLTLGGEAFEDFLEDIAETILVKPRNAKFAITDGKVTEFVGSTSGVELDLEETKSRIEYALDAEEHSLHIAILERAPDIETGDVNDLGVSELLGVGISDYSNSPANRISNIRNAVKILNGILIAPDETFSLVEALQPFTYKNGFLPELVISGDEIKPEMGGGACQIGTTTFRATMNSGLPVIERRNHSLVVGHYNDPVNGNPGTDATIYEVNGRGAPDYKFLNDTGHYILFQAEMLTQSEELRFSFWGTSDGRKGSYTPPVVDRWIGAGPKKEIITTDLEPGKKKCQGSFTGADAHFTYTIERPDGSLEKTLYESHYRALPTICLVGAEKPSEDEEIETENEEDLEEPQAPAEDEESVDVSESPDEPQPPQESQEPFSETENASL